MKKILIESLNNLEKLNNDKNIKIKIFGERNSGTNFIEKLLRSNFKNITICSNNFNGGTGWKHGVPNYYFLNKIKGKIIYIIVFRELLSWLNSMYNNPYHINKRNNFYEFIISKIKKKTQMDTDVKHYKWETSYNLFNLRYLKYMKLIELFNNKNNVILLNLSWLQNDKGTNFINILTNSYCLNRKFNHIKYIEKHTKTNKNQVNDTYKIYKLTSSIYKKYVNFKIEHQINDLTIISKNKDFNNT